MRTLELTPSGLLATAAVFVVIAVCVRLGVWQLDRREQRATRNATIEARAEQPPIPLGSAPPDTAGLTYRRARVEGRYDNGRALVLAGRSHAGAPGVHVMAPLRTADGAILVNRGWLPSPDAATADLTRVAVDTPVAVTGMLVPFPDVEIERRPGEDGFRTTWFRLDGESIRNQYPYAVAPLYLVAEAVDEAAGRRAAPLPVGPPSLDAGPHLSYALQWFGFAVVFLVGWAVLVLKGGPAQARRAPGQGRGASEQGRRGPPGAGTTG